MEMKTNVSVLSYNILTESYCTALSYPHCTPASLNTDHRFEQIKRKLKNQIETNKPVIALQEVSRTFSAHLYTFFESVEYCFVYASCHSPGSGYMGVALAYPRELYALKDLKIKRVTDLCANWPTTEWEEWKTAKECTNVVILPELRHKKTSKEFFVGVYHMPCAYGSIPKMRVMNIHLILLLQHCQDVSSGRPLIILGDFNFYPVDSCYRLVLEGRIDGNHPEKPDPWPLVIDNNTNGWFKNMRSAYKEMGGEPKFTCLHNGTDDKFGEVLDYIFVSSEWDVKSVIRSGINLEEYKSKGITSLPTLEEPSDHILIGATLEMNH